MRAMLWALESGAHVMSMSLGLDFPGLVGRWTDNGLALQPATSRALEGYRDNLRLFGRLADVIRASGPYGRTALVVAATGNESQRGAPPPRTRSASRLRPPPKVSSRSGRYGATRDGPSEVADFSNVGASVAAPGVDILSAKHGRRLHRHERDEHGYSARRGRRGAVGREPAGLRGTHRFRPAARASHRATARSCRESTRSMPVPGWCVRRSRGRHRGGPAMARPATYPDPVSS